MEHTLLCQASYSGCDHQPIHLLLLSSSLMFECTVCLWMDIKKIKTKKNTKLLLL